MARHALFVPMIVAALAGCEPQTTMTSAPYEAPVVATHVSYGRIIAEHPVTMQQTASGDRIGGALVGGLAGAIIGNQFGGGTGKDLMTGAGAVTGAVIGGNLASQTRTYVVGHEQRVHAVI